MLKKTKETWQQPRPPTLGFRFAIKCSYVLTACKTRSMYLIKKMEKGNLSTWSFLTCCGVPLPLAFFLLTFPVAFHTS